MQACFGATLLGTQRVMEASCSPITRIQCSHCLPESPVEYVIWGDTSATEAEKEKAVVLFARLIREAHPDHNPLVYAASTLDELREQLWRKLAGLLLGDTSAYKRSREQQTIDAF